MVVHKNTYTYALVRLESGHWGRAIVSGYIDPRRYGRVVVVFHPEYTPDPALVDKIMNSIEVNPEPEIQNEYQLNLNV